MNYNTIKPDKEGFIETPGGKVYYRINHAKNNTNKAPLVLLHGGPGMGHRYLLPLVELASERDVIFYDQLDTGKSKGANNKDFWTLDYFTEELALVCKGLALKYFHIGASSWGCSIAVNYTAGKPEGLKSVLLSGALVSTKRWVDDNTAYRGALPQDVQRILDKYEAERDYGADEYQAATEVFYRQHLCRLNEWPDYLNESLASSNFEQYLHMWGPTEFLCTGTLKEMELSPKLKEIAAPVLFISGEFDEGTPAASTDFAAKTKNAEVYVVKDASHTPHIEKTDEFMRVAEGFLSRYD